jgi:hypothetical protein
MLQRLKILVGIYCCYLSFASSAAEWNGVITLSDTDINYAIKDSKDISKAQLFIDKKASINFPTLDGTLLGALSTIKHHNYGRLCFASCCCCLPLVGVLLSSKGKNKIKKVRALIKAAYTEDKKVLANFKKHVVSYLDNIVSGKIMPSAFVQINPAEAQRWRNITTEEVAVYIRRLNLAGVAVLGKDRGGEAMEVDLTSCCCISNSDVYFDIDVLAQQVVNTPFTKGGNFEDSVQDNLNKRIKSMLEGALLIRQVQEAAVGTTNLQQEAALGL